ncbi:tetratricopeptide repeat protein [Winogradskyella haliclonae]|uniref:Tetratricopeptide repeat protein n=1 Tax=Winogradskyella haliclonae TaxID=2048558 RepID=A0ABQ2C1R7_9FLAO|nr:cell surface protein [Winogradskyella haliclonae]GGI57997.1 hypothetical protein GCM10011444_23060 [Winogradskyella haliclonae]
MMSTYKLLILLLFIAFYSCDSKKVTDIKDYKAFLIQNGDNSVAKEDIAFWTNKLDKTPNEYLYMVKRANAYTNLFSATGKIDYLIDAENDLVNANTLTNYNTSGCLKALAHNYISQHRFKEAHTLLKKAEVLGEKLRGTQKMLFDVNLELGNSTEAEKYLNKIKNFSDFDYLIRLSKWEDHNGNLDSAITYMERATKISESSNTTSLKQWSYTNLADFYGHAGKIDLSYHYYIKALELNPNDAYAKKGIAWIVYSHEKNPEAALNLLNHISSYYYAPDYSLFKAEIAEFIGDEDLKQKAYKTYMSEGNNRLYGDMYNKYNALLYADEMEKPKKAIEIAMYEVKNRPTAQSYDLLAWSYFKDGNLEEANTIVEKHIAGKTSEPDVLYHMAEIYKAVGKTDKVSPLKEELLASIYELGPLAETKIVQL